MKNFLYKFMSGRNGTDDLARYCIFDSLIVLIISCFFKGYPKTILWWIAVIILGYSYFRVFSRNLNKRYQENTAFVIKKNKLLGKLRNKKEMFAQRKQYCFYKCPNCGIMNRVPKGKGKIQITCPKCNTKFIKET